jgi:hypothetical protein
MSTTYTDTLPLPVAVAAIAALGKKVAVEGALLHVTLPSGALHVFSVSDPLRRRDVSEIARRLKVEPHMIWHIAGTMSGAAH